jgi:hypothetical protein
MPINIRTPYAGYQDDLEPCIFVIEAHYKFQVVPNFGRQNAALPGARAYATARQRPSKITFRSLLCLNCT